MAIDYKRVGPQHHLAIPLIQQYLLEVIAQKPGAYPPEIMEKIYTKKKLLQMRDSAAHRVFCAWLESAKKYDQQKEKGRPQ